MKFYISLKNFTTLVVTVTVKLNMHGLTLHKVNSESYKNQVHDEEAAIRSCSVKKFFLKIS